MIKILNYSDVEEDTVSAQVVFEESKRRIKEKKQKIKDLENELGLLEEQALRNYKNYVYYTIPVKGSVINSARKWLDMVKEGSISKRKKCDEKTTYNTLNKHISQILGVSISITEIIDFCFGQATIFEFDYKGDRWQLEVPNVESIRLDNFCHYGEWYFQLKLNHRRSDYVTENIVTTFKEEDLKKAMQKVGETNESTN